MQVNLKNIFETLPPPQNAHIGPKKAQNYPKYHNIKKSENKKSYKMKVIILNE